MATRIAQGFSKSTIIMLMLVCLAITVILYSAGLSGGLGFDDAHVIENNPFIKINEITIYALSQAANSFAAGGRELSMLSFAFNYYFFGDSVWWFKFVNLIIHCANGAGLFFFARRLIVQSNNVLSTSSQSNLRQFIPLVATGLWLVHPINLVPVLYVSQRMALLSSFFIIYGLLLYVVIRNSTHTSARRLIYIFIGLGAFMLLGFKCKENAILLPVYALILEVAIFKFQTNNQKDKLIIGLFAVGIAIAVVLIGYKFWHQPNWIVSGYNGRFFSLDERIFTQFRALVFYIYQILVPSNSQLSLWHDDFGLSKGLFSPISTFYSILTLSGLMLGALILIKKMPLFTLGVLWFFVSHSLESTIIPLELVHEHRNYLASFGILLGLVVIVAEALNRKSTAFFLLCAGLFCAYSFVLYERSNIWSNDYVHAKYEAENRPNSAAATFNLGKLYYISAMEGASGWETIGRNIITRSIQNDHYTIAPDLLMVLLSEHPNIEYENTWINSAIDKLRKYPFMAPSKAALQGFMQCLADEQCQIPRSDAERLFQIALDSGNVNLMTTAANYYALVEKDIVKAEQTFKKIISRRKNAASSWVTYIHFLIHQEDIQAACTTYAEFINKVQKNDFEKINLQAKSIEYFEERLKAC